jgi:hypothetical protein
MTAGDGISTTGARLPGRAGAAKRARLAAAEGAFLLSMPLPTAAGPSQVAPAVTKPALGGHQAVVGGGGPPTAPLEGLLASGARLKGKKRSLANEDDPSPVSRSKRTCPSGQSIPPPELSSSSSGKLSRKLARAREKEAKAAEKRLAKAGRRAEREARRMAKAARRAARAEAAEAPAAAGGAGGECGAGEGDI